MNVFPEIRDDCEMLGEGGEARNNGCREFDITEIDITETAITEFDITDTAITESDITESDITRKGKLL